MVKAGAELRRHELQGGNGRKEAYAQYLKQYMREIAQNPGMYKDVLRDADKFLAALEMECGLNSASAKAA